ncbi:MAG: START-like domain-containing protein [Bacteroidota bacterium]
MAKKVETVTKKQDKVIKKQKYTVEFEIHASPKILYPYISTSSGLTEWFAKRVTDSRGIFVFEWEGSKQNAKLVSRHENQSVKFHWIDDPDETFFEIEIVQDDLTSDVALIITDFCYPDEKEENTLLWESQIHDLMHVVGSQF